MRNITFHRCVDSDFKEIQILFKITFNQKISKKFYKWRYCKENKFNSFIVKLENKVIGHVGYVEYEFNNKISRTNTKIYSRHSSMVLPELRRHNIYSLLVKWSLNKLEKNSIVVIWPNKMNSHTNKKLQIIFNLKYYLYRKKILNKSFKKIKKFEFNKFSKLNSKNLINILNDSLNTKSIINKDLKYFNWRYKEYDCKSYYYYEYEINQIKNIFIIGKVIKYNKKFISILDFIGDEKFYYTILDDLIDKLKRSKFSNNNYILQIWSNKNDKRKISYLKRNKFKSSDNMFNICILKTKKSITKILNKLNFNMGDTDVFININKNN